MISKFKRPDDSPGFLLWKLTTQWQKKQREALSLLGLTHGQFVFLASLYWLSFKSEEKITQAKISELAKVDKMVISEITKKLVEKKVILRKKHESDSPSYVLSLTKKGSELIKEALPIVESIDTKYFEENKNKIAQLYQLTNV